MSPLTRRIVLLWIFMLSDMQISPCSGYGIAMYLQAGGPLDELTQLIQGERLLDPAADLLLAIVGPAGQTGGQDDPREGNPFVLVQVPADLRVRLEPKERSSTMKSGRNFSMRAPHSYSLVRAFELRPEDSACVSEFVQPAGGAG